ncbi:MAG: hypothetical protein U0V74_04135 [Chitinophagales bacterium]
MPLILCNNLMRKQDYLVQLIKSLSPSEKRYFKLFCQSQTGGKKYLALFNALEGAETYDAAALSKLLKIEPSNLAHEKEYLQDVLLRNLRIFHENNFVESNLMAQYQEADLLYRKGLTTYSISKAEKALKKVMKFERFGLALGLLRLLSHCYSHLSLFAEMEAVNAQEDKLLEVQHEFMSLIHLRDRFRKPVMNRTGFDELKDVKDNPLFNRKPNTFKSWHAEHCWNEIGMFYYQYIERNPHKALEHAQNQIKQFHKHPHFRSILPSGYYNSFASVCIRQYTLGHYREALNSVNQLIEKSSAPIPEVSAVLTKRFNNFGKVTKMTLLSLLHEFTEAKHWGQQVSKIIDDVKPGERLTFWLDYSLSLFHTGDLDGCMVTLNKLMDYKTKERVDIQLYARLLFIMLQLQLKNYQLIPYQVKSARAWKKRAKTEAEGSTELLAWFDKLGKAGLQLQWKETFAEFKEALQNDPLKELSQELALNKWKGPEIGRRA